MLFNSRGGEKEYISIIVRGREIYNLPVNLFNFPVKQEKRCINPPLRAGDRVRVS